ncbi:hypothetical protein [Peribacillus tepidiphilus]|jgi:hypothetical protein|uniref:hypothetical protein n=1 Tax=Peribacillus tepidiphilus TaxID=2652445 RepID=UPI0012929C65|nr:hypothetical protein [Peribacillus tepidiphilus]
MIDGLQKAVDEFIEKRLEALLTSREYQMYAETIYKDLEEKLLVATESLEGDARDSLIEDIRANIFDQVLIQSKIAYRQAFSDALVFIINTLIIPKKL